MTFYSNETRKKLNKIYCLQLVIKCVQLYNNSINTMYKLRIYCERINCILNYIYIYLILI